MKHLNLTKRLFWIVAFLVIASNGLVTVYLYNQSQSLAQTRAYSKAKTLQEYFLSMRYIYQQQFIDSKIDLNESTVGFLPIHASAHINDDLQERSTQGIVIKNVSKNPRNLKNKANSLEQTAIDYFSANPHKNEKIELFEEEGENFYFFSSPLRMDAFCLQCHGKKNEVLPYISNHYESAFDYKLGEVGGIISIKMPEKTTSLAVMSIFWQEAIFSWFVMSSLLLFMYIVIKELTKRDVEQKRELETLVAQRTKSLAQKSFELENAYIQQKHLYSVLRTVADSNQILITTKSLDELLAQTALCLYRNDSFASVKITILEKGELKVKESHGFDNDREVNFMEKYVFEQNSSLQITEFTENIPHISKNKISKYGITEVYATVLKSDSYALTPLGTLSIYTTIKGGYSLEEREMIEELAGDIGFAVNSFLQKENIIKLSYYDTLTNLPNKAMLIEQVKKCMDAADGEQCYGALLFMDLDNFKSINDLKGHGAGDKLLVMMAKRLQKIVRPNDIIARFGGDEFAILLPHLGMSVDEVAIFAEEMAKNILEATKEPFIIENHPFYLTGSIGIGLFDNNDTVDELISHADSAMYTAKAGGRNTVRFFDANIQKIMEEKSYMLQQLRDAIDSQQFMLHYQIQVDIHQKVIGVEALVRWLHREKGLISPASFIPLCEESGLIVPLGIWVLKEAIAQAVSWKDDAIKSQWRVSINVSAKQFEQETFVMLVEEMIKKASINPSLIRLELTESLLIGDAKKALQKLAKLKSIGLSLSIDDFGTGYSSLQYLKQFSVDELKIDQSFIRDFLFHQSDASIVEAIISIGKKFNMEVIAEGVETQEQFEILKEMGCENFQGYLFGKPMTPENL